MPYQITKRLFFCGIIFLSTISLLSFGDGNSDTDARPNEKKIGDHVRIATDLDDTFIALPTSVMFRFHETAEQFDNEITEELLAQISQKYRESYGGKKNFVKITLNPLKIKFLSQREFENKFKKNNEKNKSFFIQLIRTDEYADLKNEINSKFYFNEKSFYRSRSDEALLEDAKFKFEERDSFKMARKLSSSNVPLDEIFSFITAREHSQIGLQNAIKMVFGPKRVVSENNIHPLSNNEYLRRCKMTKKSSMPQRKAKTILTILDELKKFKSPSDKNIPTIKNPCFSGKRARSYKVFQFFDDDTDNIQGVLNSLKDPSNYKIYNQYGDMLVIVRQVGKKKKNYAICRGRVVSISEKRMGEIENYIENYYNYLNNSGERS